jgi:phosphoglycolate phosphatase-like HAD superfamily hydrolase
MNNVLPKYRELKSVLNKILMKLNEDLYENFDAYIDEVEKSKEDLKAYAKPLMVYPESFLITSFEAFINSYYTGSIRSFIDNIADNLEGIKQIIDGWFADVENYQEFIDRFDEFNEIPDPEIQRMIKKLYDKIEESEVDRDWIRVFVKYTLSKTRLDGRIIGVAREKGRKIDELLIKYFIEYE